MGYIRSSGSQLSKPIWVSSYFLCVLLSEKSSLSWCLCSPRPTTMPEGLACGQPCQASLPKSFVHSWLLSLSILTSIELWAHRWGPSQHLSPQTHYCSVSVHLDDCLLSSDQSNCVFEHLSCRDPFPVKGTWGFCRVWPKLPAHESGRSLPGHDWAPGAETQLARVHEDTLYQCKQDWRYSAGYQSSPTQCCINPYVYSIIDDRGEGRWLKCKGLIAVCAHHFIAL